MFVGKISTKIVKKDETISILTPLFSSLNEKTRNSVDQGDGSRDPLFVDWNCDSSSKTSKVPINGRNPSVFG